MSSDDTIFANLIRRCALEGDQTSNITFLNINSKGEFEEDHRDYTSLWQNGNKFAVALRDEGVQEGDKFCLLMQNHPEFVDLMVASSIIGSVYVPVDPRTRGDKLVYMIDFADSVGVVCADYVLDNLLEIKDRLPKLKWIWVLNITGHEVPNGLCQTSDILAREVEELEIVPVDPLQMMQLLYTSGTTGDPKAIMAPYARFAQSGPYGKAFGIVDSDKLYTGLSLTHANAQMLTLGVALYLGNDCVISRKFTKSRLWDITRAYNCTSFNLLGGMASAIYAESVSENDGNNPVRQVLSGGMPIAIWEEFSERFGVQIKEAYGAAEGGMAVNLGDGPIGSCGKPVVALEMKIFDENDHEVAAGTAGEICFRPANSSPMRVAYFKNPEASAKKIRGGWLRMGDIGHVDDDDWLYFHYRDGGAIRRNGDFINSGFVEKVLAEFDAVNDVYVYGIPTSDGAPGEKDPIAAVVAGKGQSIDIEALFSHCKSGLETNSIPAIIQVVSEIPKTASEKPQDRFLIEMLVSNPENVFHIQK